MSDITYSSIDSMEEITHSDHNLVTCLLHTGDCIRNFRINDRRRRDKLRFIYKYNKTTEDDWSKYRQTSTRKLRNDNHLHSALQATTHTQQSIDLIWKSLAFHITNAANTHLPKKKVTYRPAPRPASITDYKPIKMVRFATTLRKIIEELRLESPPIISETELNKHNDEIAAINSNL